mgnify:FL=1|tara:strand:+ start:252 stop:764 length:513 start_codon:yes stop_codon:yes gene_type:complete
MIDISFYLRRFSSLILLIFFGFINSGCSDFRQAIGKEKFIPNEYSFLNTPQLIMPPGFGSKENIVENKSTNDLKPKLDFKNKVNVSNLNSLFNFSIVPQDIRKIVDEETLGIRRSERTGIDVLLGNSPSVGVYLDSEKEAIRIKNNKEKSLLTNPSPSVNTLDNKTQLIK